MKTQITRRIVFHAGHMLKDDNSKCYHPHGHEYVVECTVGGVVQDAGVESGMVMNFGTLKQIMMERIHDELDHKFMIQDTDPRLDAFINAVDPDGVIIFNVAPTAENLAKRFFYVISKQLVNSKVYVVNVRVQETLNCWAEYTDHN